MSGQLDPQVAALVEQMRANPTPPLYTMSPEAARAFANPVIAQFSGAPEPVAKVENRVIPGNTGIRVYTPEGDGPFPIVMYFHGGGWVICNLDTHDSQCRSLANRAGCVVVSVDYGLSPENKFPTALEDCYRATKWASDNSELIHGDPARIAVCGDSSGGTMAAGVTLMVRDQNGPALQYQVLIYPALNLAAFDSPSYQQYGTGFSLTTTEMEWYRSLYFARPEDAQNPYASPMLAKDLSGLPSTLIVTAEMDVLTSDGEHYAQRLREAGIEVEYKCYEGMIHPFLSMRAMLSRGDEALTYVAEQLHSNLYG